IHGHHAHATTPVASVGLTQQAARGLAAFALDFTTCPLSRGRDSLGWGQLLVAIRFWGCVLALRHADGEGGDAEHLEPEWALGRAAEGDSGGPSGASAGYRRDAGGAAGEWRRGARSGAADRRGARVSHRLRGGFRQ